MAKDGKRKIRAEANGSRTPSVHLRPQCEDCPRRQASPSFGFKYQVRGLKSFSQLSVEDQIAVLESFCKMEGRTWHEVYATASKNPALRTGLCYTPAPDKSLLHDRPDSLPKDVDLYHFRFSDVGRVFGFRKGDVFNIAWFDPNHGSQKG